MLDGEAAAAYETLAATAERIDLAPGRTRPAVETEPDEIASRILDANVASALRDLSARLDAPVSETLLAAFCALLYRYSGQRDLIVGAALDREAPAIADAFATLRVRANGRTTFRELQLDVRASIARTGRSAPGVPGAPPPFNVAFEATPPAGVRPAPAGLDAVARFEERDGRFVVSLAYRSDLVDRAWAERLLAHFETLVAGIVRDPACELRTLPLLTPAETHRQLVEWNDTKRPLPADASLVGLFERRARLAPNAIAVAEEGRELTYERLDELASGLARELCALEVAREELVGVCTEASIATVVAILAVLKAGAAYLPIDPANPLERVRRMLADASPRIVVTHATTTATIAAADPAVLTIDVDRGETAPRDRVLPALRSDDHVVCVMYTSGSTGVPKGVMLTQHGALRLVLGVDYCTVAPGDVVGGVSNVAFDAFTFELWSALLHGGRLQIAPARVLLSPHDLANWIEARRVGIMFLTSALFRFVAAERPTAFAGMTCLMVGGEPVDPAAARAVLTGGAPRRLVNGYGPTEATTFALTYDIAAAWGERVPIGRPIANTDALVLDADLNLVPVGSAGELFLGGLCLARGYLNDPQRTAERFVPHPFQPGARLYATGDLVRFLPDGTVDILGRRDHQLKIRGFRIEPGEIEAALRCEPGIRDAFVHTGPGPDDERRIRAYVVGSGEAGRPLAEWRRALAASLPSYMMPAAVIAVDRIPLTTNGKVDVAALPEPPVSSAGRLRDNTLHHQLAMIWEGLLGTAPGVDDEFFDLGGDSLLAARMIAAVERETGVALSIGGFIERPTIAHLTGMLVARSSAPGTVAVDDRDGGGVPLFFLHGDLTGGGYYARRLARGLDRNRPIYVSPPHDLNVTPTIDAMAADYARVVRELRPDGPYALGGFCVGGLVALETARLLRDDGADVEHVVLIDSAGVNHRYSRLAAALDRQAARVRLPGGRATVTRVLVAASRIAATALRLRRFVAKNGLAGLARRAVTPPVLDAEELLFARWAAVQADYVPRPYAGAATVLASRERDLADGLDAETWRRIAPAATVHDIEGDHVTCVTRFVEATAARMAAILAERPSPIDEPREIFH